MPSLKRSYDVANGDSDHAAPLHRVRSMWQFANLVQWVYIFGKAAKIDESIDVEVLEDETQKHSSSILEDVALALVKLASSFRGIASDGLDDQLRKLYRTHAPELNPFGNEDSPTAFDALDSLTKIRVLQQLTQWVMIHPERFRDKMEEQKDIDQTSWRIEPYGWDSEDRTYFVLDDNRLYRMTDAPPPPPPAKKSKKMKTYRSGRRSSRRQRVTSTTIEDETADSTFNEEDDDSLLPDTRPTGDETLGGMVWECVAVTLGEVETFLDGIARTRDNNEKILRNQVRDHLLPILQKQEESRKRREQQRERELLNQAKMANAKRSSRIAGKIEQQKHDEEAKKHEAQMRQAEAAERREEADKLRRERERDNRMASREERLKDRENRRRRHEEELAQLSEDSRNMSERSGRVSERKLQADIERNQQALKELEEEEEDWIFDCACGLYGKIDDGEHSIACERCNVWQHSKCAGISEIEAERRDFHFVCPRCLKQEEMASLSSRTTIKLKVHGSSSRPTSAAGDARSSIVVEIPAKPRELLLQNGNAANGLPLSTSVTAANVLAQRSGTGAANNSTLPASETSGIQAPIDSTLRVQDKPMLQTSAAMEAPRNSQSQSQSMCGDMNGSGPLPVTTPSQDRQNGGRVNGMGAVQLVATPSLGEAGQENKHGLQLSPGGLSPTKSSPQVASTAGDAARATKLTLSPMTSLAPAPRPQDLTPPIKPADGPSSFSSETNVRGSQ